VRSGREAKPLSISEGVDFSPRPTHTVAIARQA
jgi:hypothetical protein